MESISKKYIKNLLQKRRTDTHKGTYGKVLIIAGSLGMTGAAVLAAKGALRGGAGLVRVSIDETLFPIIQNSVTEATCVHPNMGAHILEEYDSIIIGPGLSTSQEGVFAVAKLMANYKGNVVMDADALNIIAQNNVELRTFAAGKIITPHPGEAGKLIGIPVSEINANREKAVSFLADSTGSVAVLKGHGTLISLPRKTDKEPVHIFKNPTGNPGMATGGSGDVLSGVIGAFLAQGMNLKDAAMAGVYIHGLAGDLAAKEFGEYGLIAGDIAKYVAYAIKHIQNQ